MNGWSESDEVESPPDFTFAAPPRDPRVAATGRLAGLDGRGVVRNAADVIDRESAVRAVETQLERDYQRWRAMDEAALRMTVVDVEEHALVWIVHWTSETFVRTGDPAFMLAGNGPYLVDRVDGDCMRSASSLRLRGRGRTTTGAV